MVGHAHEGAGGRVQCFIDVSINSVFFLHNFFQEFEFHRYIQEMTNFLAILKKCARKTRKIFNVVNCQNSLEIPKSEHDLSSCSGLFCETLISLAKSVQDSMKTVENCGFFRNSNSNKNAKNV